MSQYGITPERVTKPIQLLAAWLIGLFVTNASFLFAAQQISHPSWGSAMLLIAAVANVPAFIIALFLLQTKFRPQMQEDSYYSRYLDEERRFKGSSRPLSKDGIDEEISETAEKIAKSIGATAEGKQPLIRKILENSQIDLMVYKHGTTRALSELVKAYETWPKMVKKWGKNSSFTKEVDGFISDGLATLKGDDLTTLKLTSLGEKVAKQAEDKGLLFIQKRPKFWARGRSSLSRQDAGNDED